MFLDGIVDWFGGGGEPDSVPQLANPTLGNSGGFDYNQIFQNRMGQAGPQINQAPQNQFRDQQMGFINQLQSMANGQGPSLVQGQLQQATDQNLAQQSALAASARGGNAGMAQRVAAQNAGNIQQQAAQQSAQARQNEMLAAYGMLGNQLNQGRQQDIGLASNQAQLDLGAQGQKDVFGNALMNNTSNRDLGLMQGQIQGQNSAAQLQELYRKRRQQGIKSFGDALGALGPMGQQAGKMFGGGGGAGAGGAAAAGGGEALGGADMASMGAMFA